ncbi:hypothetical protein CspHIS471_0203830 [Cutaneotrichosporon sp. HIS471]|nr:hypothetical protein CspHIS471_0203830 [Cutaneotrichosporon sp. HIS471]
MAPTGTPPVPGSAAPGSSDGSHGSHRTKRARMTSTESATITIIDSSDDEFEYGVEEDDEGAFICFSDDGGDIDLIDEEEEEPLLIGLPDLEEDMAYAACMLEGTDITLRHVLYDLVITLPLVDLPPLQRAAYGLTSSDPISITMHLNNGYRRTSPKPAVSVRHGDPKSGPGIETSSSCVNPGFPLGLKLMQTTLNFFNDRWESNRGESFLSDLALRLDDHMLNAGSTCMMCNQDLAFPGLKPTVCDRELCSYQLDHVGLGADLSLFDTDYKVADLLISFAVAACNDTKRHTVSPIATPVDPASGQPYSPLQLGRLLNQFPSAEILRDVGSKRNNFLKESSPNALFIAGWVFASNRAHIVSIAEEKHIMEMGTQHQFQIHTCTRKHAEKFEALRAKHGSIWAFHGSPMSNWHNILRQNLKNASKTPMMSAGAAYGEGVYLAASSQTSASFSKTSTAWDNSAFGINPMCIALVEVANSSRVHDHADGSIIVVNDENCVMLRQLFVYPYGGMPIVAAKDIAQARYKNRTTIAYGSTFDEVRASGKLLVTSDDYFWDIDEVVQSIKAKNGLFINPYNNLPFQQRDVKLILTHPSGAGEELSHIEAENTELKRNISSEVMSRLHSVGYICKKDNSTDFVIAMGAISELNEWLKLRPTRERDALACVPFQAIDSHTRIPFRNTVTHALELVISGGECTHRFSDFLAQIK